MVRLDEPEDDVEPGGAARSGERAAAKIAAKPIWLEPFLMSPPGIAGSHGRMAVTSTAWSAWPSPSADVEVAGLPVLADAASTAVRSSHIRVRRKRASLLWVFMECWNWTATGPSRTVSYGEGGLVGPGSTPMRDAWLWLKALRRHAALRTELTKPSYWPPTTCGPPDLLGSR